VCVAIEAVFQIILHDFVSIVVVDVRNLCGLWLASALFASSVVTPQMLSVRGVVIWSWLDCARDVTIVLVVAALHIRLTLLLGHDLLLRPVKLILTVVPAALVIAVVIWAGCKSSQFSSGRVQLLPIGVFVAQSPIFFSGQRRVNQSTKYFDTIWDAACSLLKGSLKYLGRNGYLEICHRVFAVLLLTSPG
jgi:hypothetical protein